MPSEQGFFFRWRNPGHWDVWTQDGRAFRIRGEEGAVKVSDERTDPTRPFPREWLRFRTVNAATLWIADELMQETRDAE